MRTVIKLRKRNLTAAQKQYEENDFIHAGGNSFLISAINMPFRGAPLRFLHRAGIEKEVIRLFSAGSVRNKITSL